MIKHYDIRIHGRVQGVFFRASAQSNAHHYGVKGYAQNEPDGTVFIEAEGDEEPLQKFIEWCHEGSSAAKVEKVDYSEGDIKNFKGFEIR